MKVNKIVTFKLELLDNKAGVLTLLDGKGNEKESKVVSTAFLGRSHIDTYVLDWVRGKAK